MKTTGFTGKDIGVVILDTGIYPHIDFDHRIVCFKDFVNQKTAPYDDNGHGTHVAGILAGSGKGSNGKYRGIASGCNIISCKILDKNGNGRMVNIFQAIDWILENYKKYNIRIVNISVGSISSSNSKKESLIQYVDNLWDQGLTVVAAAGNMGPKPGSITVPGSSRKVITVGSSDLLDTKTGISGVGPTSDCICKPDIVAPGASVISCAAGPKNSYTQKSGTSMSTPIVSGAIALLLEKNPLLTNVEIKMLLKEAAVDMGYARNQQGWGKLDINKLLKLS